MKKSAKSKNKATSVPIDPYLEGLMGKLLERLTALERKMDAVLAQTAARSSANSEPPRVLQAQPPRAEQPRRERMMHESICADCQKVCEVPFKPVEGRAIYCKPCFARRKLGGAGAVNAMPKPVALYQNQSQASVAFQAQTVVASPIKKEKKGKTAKKSKKGK